MRRFLWHLRKCLPFGLVMLLALGVLSSLNALNGAGNLTASPKRTLAARAQGADSVFVTRAGTSLLLNGQPFLFAGANIYWLGLE